MCVILLFRGSTEQWTPLVYLSDPVCFRAIAVSTLSEKKIIYMEYVIL